MYQELGITEEIVELIETSEEECLEEFKKN